MAGFKVITEADRALLALDIRREAFDDNNGNFQGYALVGSKTIAVSPISFDPIKTASHEVAHILLGHTQVPPHGEKAIPKDVKECEAELVAYLCSTALGIIELLQYSLGYIQHWREDTTTEKIRYPVVFNVTDQILKGGRSKPVRPDGSSPGSENLALH